MNELKYLNVCYNLKENDEKFDEFISSYINNVFKYDNQNELINLINSKNIHLVITKYNFELLKEIRTLNNQIQIIAYLDELNHTHLIESLEIEYVKFIQKLNCINEFIYILKDCVKNIDSKKSNLIKLKNNFIYDSYNKTLFKKNEVIYLTKRETLFLDLLIKKHNKALGYDEINKEIWNNTMSQDALRSLVKEIRKKTYKELIKNVSGIGYRIDM
ncbi:MAG: winged helix-turn-helix domain-containing protein [Aliarcobacter sp.]|nr:winged helix-turn-helix domain-containing protein [Aliarcobacter sp.]